MRHLVIPRSEKRLNCQFHDSLITVLQGVYREGNIAKLSLPSLFRRIQKLEHNECVKRTNKLILFVVFSLGMSMTIGGKGNGTFLVRPV